MKMFLAAAGAALIAVVAYLTAEHAKTAYEERIEAATMAGKLQGMEVGRKICLKVLELECRQKSREFGL